MVYCPDLPEKEVPVLMPATIKEPALATMRRTVILFPQCVNLLQKGPERRNSGSRPDENKVFLQWILGQTKRFVARALSALENKDFSLCSIVFLSQQEIL